jgi:exosortase
MVDPTTSPSAAPAAARSPDAERGFFDLPDFGAIFRAITGWSSRNPLGVFLLVGMFGVLGYFYFGVKAFQGLSQAPAAWIAASWNEDNDQQHCWAIIPISILLVLLRWRDLLAAPKEPANKGLWLVGLGLLAFFAGVRCVEGRHTIIALTFLFLGFTAYLFGWSVARIVSFPCIFLLFMMPLGSVVQHTVGLQAATASVIKVLSTLLGIPVTVDGDNIYSLDGRFKPLEVAGGCSGIRSLMAMTTLAALYAYFMMKGPVRGLLLFLSSLLFAVLGNFARVFSVVLFARFIDPKIATGLYHDYSGFVFFPVAVLAMVAVGSFINRDWESWWARVSTPTVPRTLKPAAAGAAPSVTETKPAPENPSNYDY